MEDPSQAVLPPSLTVAFLVLLGASVVAGSWIVARWVRGAPVLAYEKRRQSPWRPADVLIVFVLFELGAPLLFPLVQGFLPGANEAGPAINGSTVAEAAEEVDVQHPLVDLLNADAGVATWLLCILVAVVVAPLVEEFTYRLVLQGWVEAEERRARRRIPKLRRLVPGAIPVVTVSVLFALRHFRTASAPLDPALLKQAMLFHAVWSLLAFGAAVLFLRLRSGATVADFGFVGKRFVADVRLGLVVFAAVGAPIILLQPLLSKYVFPASVAADPVPLFFLAAVLGFVFYRTHRITPVIVIHLALNATSLGLAWLQL